MVDTKVIIQKRIDAYRRAAVIAETEYMWQLRATLGSKIEALVSLLLEIRDAEKSPEQVLVDGECEKLFCPLCGQNLHTDGLEYSCPKCGKVPHWKVMQLAEVVDTRAARAKAEQVNADGKRVER